MHFRVLYVGLKRIYLFYERFKLKNSWFCPKLTVCRSRSILLKGTRIINLQKEFCFFFLSVLVPRLFPLVELLYNIYLIGAPPCTSSYLPKKTLLEKSSSNLLKLPWIAPAHRSGAGGTVHPPASTMRPPRPLVSFHRRFHRSRRGASKKRRRWLEWSRRVGGSEAVGWELCKIRLLDACWVVLFFRFFLTILWQGIIEIWIYTWIFLSGCWMDDVWGA